MCTVERNQHVRPPNYSDIHVNMWKTSSQHWKIPRAAYECKATLGFLFGKSKTNLNTHLNTIIIMLLALK